MLPCAAEHDTNANPCDIKLSSHDFVMTPGQNMAENELYRSLSTGAKRWPREELAKRPIRRHTCDVCLTQAADLVCPCDRHYACTECFDAYVRHQCDDALYLLKNREGMIYCFDHTQGCEAKPFTEKELCTHVSTETFRCW